MKVKRKYLAFALLLVIFVLIIVYFPMLAELKVSDILKYSPKTPLFAAFVLIGIYCLKSVVMIIPVLVLYISAGVMFPGYWAIIITYIGLFCELSLGYLVGCRLGNDKVAALMDKNEKAKNFLTFNEDNEDKSSILCFFIRLTPLSLDFVSMFFGASGVRYPIFIAFSLLGATPKLIPFVLMGNAATDPRSKEFLIPFAISGVIVTCAFIIYRKLQKEK